MIRALALVFLLLATTAFSCPGGFSGWGGGMPPVGAPPPPGPGGGGGEPQSDSPEPEYEGDPPVYVPPNRGMPCCTIGAARG